jgi:adenine-specific DNA methylase
MSIHTLCTPRPSVYAADRRATVLNLDTFLKGQVNRAAFFEESYWIPDARAELAVRGDGDDFRRSMFEIYKNLARHMPDNGLKLVMFTHQNPAVWADLGMILWAAGLKATAAWTISTETEAVAIKKGNYVQGTVCLVLRKRTANEPGFLDEVYPLVEDEVKRQIDAMQALDEDGEPNFNDADHQLAAYAAALKVLTQYGTLDGKDVEHEVFAVRAKAEKSDLRPEPTTARSPVANIYTTPSVRATGASVSASCACSTGWPNSATARD